MCNVSEEVERVHSDAYNRNEDSSAVVQQGALRSSCNTSVQVFNSVGAVCVMRRLVS